MAQSSCVAFGSAWTTGQAVNNSSFRSNGTVRGRSSFSLSSASNSRKTFIPFAKAKYPEEVSELVQNDFQFISRKHDQVVHTLNPEVRHMDALVHEVADLSEELNEAQAKVNISEKALKQTLVEMETLQQTLEQFNASASLSASTLETPRPSQPAPAKSKPSTASRSSGLESTLKIEPELKYFWYPIEFSSKLDENTLIPLDLFGESWVLFRDADGAPSCLMDECAHRACPLSLGELKDGQLSCAYHGWKFDGSGSCTEMPSTRMCKGVSVRSLPVEEKDGFIFVWAGEDREPDLNIPDLNPPEGFTIHSEITMEVPVEHGLLIENLLDLAHAPFTHTATFARGWPIPDVVRFHMQATLGGNWDPYPIDMSFLPPVMTISKIGLNQPGKIERGVRCEDCERHLHQLHVNLPAKEGHTRLLYRMSLDFMGWCRFVPGIQKIWREVANQVLGEDLTLVTGQQDRMKQGRNTWNFPVPYDKLAVRYRRWRNKLSQTHADKSRAEEVKMNAGDMFLKDEV